MALCRTRNSSHWVRCFLLVVVVLWLLSVFVGQNEFERAACCSKRRETVRPRRICATGLQRARLARYRGGAPRLVHSGWRRCRCLTPARCPPTPDLTLSSSEVERALSCLEKVKRSRAPASLSSNGAELAFLFNLRWLRVSVQMLLSFA